jgi:uncharacterized membrane protein
VKWLVAVLAFAGLLASIAALREHYRTESSPCSINDKWDCGIVNHSPYAVIGGVWRYIREKQRGGIVDFSPYTAVERIPVAVIGIAGYLVLGALALAKAWKTALAATIGGLGFSLFLTYIEAHVLQVWCIYCVASLVMISCMTISILVATFVAREKKPSS